MSSLSPDSRKLLEASRAGGGPSPAQRSAMKRAVLAAVLLPGTAAASAATGGAKATGFTLAAKLGLAVVSAAVGATLIWQVVSSTTAVAPTVPPAAAPLQEQPSALVEASAGPAQRPGDRVAPPVEQRSAAAQVRVEVTAPAPAVAPRVDLPRTTGVQVETPSAPQPVADSAPPPAAAVDEATLSREIAALSGAMGAVDARSFAVALEQLSTYRAAFPTGVLGAEASALEVLALCGLGRVDEARAAAASLPANNPAVRRLDRSCIAPPGPSPRRSEESGR